MLHILLVCDRGRCQYQGVVAGETKAFFWGITWNRWNL